MYGEKERRITNLSQNFLKERVTQYIKVSQGNVRGCGLDSSKDRIQ
jgi:hypothetical protein